MKLLEFEAKELLRVSGIPTPASEVITNKNLSLAFPVVLKSQVPTGGRGKAGGIKIVDSLEQLQPTINKLLALEIKGFTPKVVLAEEKLSIKRELYLSMVIDRTSASMQLIAHINGGVEVEENTDFQTWPIEYNNIDIEGLGQSLADYYNLPDQTFVLQGLIEHLYQCFTTNDATLIEINPLILTHDDKIVAGDAKITLDDAAAFRHDWEFEETPAESNFVTIDPRGNIATIANGAGLAMATIDAAYDAGLTPANFLDIGGGANVETLLAAFHQIIEYQNVQAIIINIFAGITRADEVAKAIIAAKDQIENLPPLFIRIAGTNYSEAATLLKEKNIAMMPSLENALTAAKEALNG